MFEARSYNVIIRDNRTVHFRILFRNERSNWYHDLLAMVYMLEAQKLFHRIGIRAGKGTGDGKERRVAGRGRERKDRGQN